MSAINIRQAHAADFDSMCCLFDEIDSLHRKALPALFRKPSGPVRDRAYVLNLIADPNVLILVAELEQKLAGLAHAFVRESTALPVFTPRKFVVIDSIIVTQAMHRHGIGRQFAEHIELWAKCQGAESIELNVYEFNREALRFYECQGYSTLSRKMSKSIEPA